MAKGFSVNCSVKGADEFRGVLKEYAIKWNKRQPAEIVAAKLYFVDANWANMIKVADKTKITTELNSNSREYPNAPLAGILVNKQLAAKGKKGLTGAKMKTAIEKYIKKATSRLQFLRSGCLPALKKLDYFNKQGDISFNKRFAPKKPQGLKQYGKDKGECIVPIRNAGRVWGRISNFAGQGKQKSATALPILLDGLSKAVKKEMQSMRDYITKKYKQQLDKINRMQTYLK